MIIDIRIWIAGLLADLAEWILPQLDGHEPKKDPQYWMQKIEDLVEEIPGSLDYSNRDEEEIEW